MNMTLKNNIFITEIEKERFFLVIKPNKRPYMRSLYRVYDIEDFLLLYSNSITPTELKN